MAELNIRSCTRYRYRFSATLLAAIKADAEARQLLAQGSVVALVGLQRPALEALAATAPYRCAVYTPDVADPQAMLAWLIFSWK